MIHSSTCNHLTLLTYCSIAWWRTLTHFFIIERGEIGCKCEREEDMKDLDTVWWRTAILTFLTMLWAYIQGLMSLLLWQEVPSQGLPSTRWLPSNWLNSHSVYVSKCLCIYNFRLSMHVTCFCCSLVYTAGTSCLVIPNDRFVTGQYATLCLKIICIKRIWHSWYALKTKLNLKSIINPIHQKWDKLNTENHPGIILTFIQYNPNIREMLGPEKKYLIPEFVFYPGLIYIH